MKKILSGILIILCLSQTSFAQQKEMCISVDDLPVVSYGANKSTHLLEITNKLISTFDSFNIPAIGFVNERKLFKNNTVIPLQVQLLEKWLVANYELGNHSFSHMNYHKSRFEDYTQDILRGEKISKDLSKKYQVPYQYFRHPFLRLGLTQARHDSLKQFLQLHGYIEAPVSIDNDDYLFAKAYHVAWEKNDHSLMKKIGTDYLAYMLAKLHYFEQSSQALFNRNIKHILLIHANKLNAEYLDDLAAAIQAEGYQFISMTEALTDTAYESEITRYGDWGISWLDRWALSQGKKGDFFKGDPVTPDYIVKLSQE